MAKRYVINLTTTERESLQQLVRRARVSGRKRLRAGILLGADEGLTDEEIADELGWGYAPWNASDSVDDEYKRCGTANIFAAVEPLTGHSIVQVTETRTAVDFAHFLRCISGEYPTATAIVLVMDNLSTHVLSCLYEAFEPKEARRLVERFELHYTPKHGSWLNVAEIFLSLLSRECLDQRIGTLAQLRSDLTAWKSSRPSARVNWRFTAADARIKLRRLYPTIS